MRLSCPQARDHSSGLRNLRGLVGSPASPWRPSPQASGCPLSVRPTSPLIEAPEIPDPTQLETKLERCCFRQKEAGGVGGVPVLQEGGVVGLNPGLTPSIGPSPLDWTGRGEN